MRFWFISLLFTLSSTGFVGCTAVSLERHTTNQAMSGAEMRYQLVLDSFARVTSNPGNLPSLGTLTDGQAFITDSASFDARTLLDGLRGFTNETLSATATRSPQHQWSIDPVHSGEQIRALQEVCKCVLAGKMPEQRADLEPHSKTLIVTLLKDFQVYRDLECLIGTEPGWFVVGCKKNAPRHCQYVGHYCDTYVWVAAGRMKGLSDFSLILTDIATIDPSSLRGTAMVAIGPHADLKSHITQQVPFRVAAATASNPHPPVQLLAPVVVYGDADKNAAVQFWPYSVPCCNAMPTYPFNREQAALEASTERRANRPYGPVGPNAGFYNRQQQEFRANQLQMQSFQ